MAVDFDNWRDWENEEDEGMAEYEQYFDVRVTAKWAYPMPMFEGWHISVALMNGFPF